MNAAKINGDTPAHPVECIWNDADIPVQGAQTDNAQGWATGLTKRELFAAMAMQGFAAAAPHSFATMNDAVEAAVMWADLLLAELAKEGES